MPDPIDHTAEARAEAERRYPPVGSAWDYLEDERAAFVAGAEWQAAQQTSGDEQDRGDMLLAVMEGIERWGDLLPTPEISGYVTDYLIREGFGRVGAAQQSEKRKAALDELARISAEAGLYDDDPIPETRITDEMVERAADAIDRANYGPDVEIDHDPDNPARILARAALVAALEGEQS